MRVRRRRHIRCCGACVCDFVFFSARFFGDAMRNSRAGWSVYTRTYDAYIYIWFPEICIVRPRRWNRGRQKTYACGIYKNSSPEMFCPAHNISIQSAHATHYVCMCPAIHMYIYSINCMYIYASERGSCENKIFLRIYPSHIRIQYNVYAPDIDTQKLKKMEKWCCYFGYFSCSHHHHCTRRACTLLEGIWFTTRVEWKWTMHIVYIQIYTNRTYAFKHVYKCIIFSFFLKSRHACTYIFLFLFVCTPIAWTGRTHIYIYIRMP